MYIYMYYMCCMNVYIYTYIRYLHTCINVYMHNIYTYTRIYVCGNVYVYICL